MEEMSDLTISSSSTITGKRKRVLSTTRGNKFRLFQQRTISEVSSTNESAIGLEMDDREALETIFELAGCCKRGGELGFFFLCGGRSTSKALFLSCPVSMQFQQ
jgi:hypothetical protein